jgi:hypothetical protein
VDVHLAAALEQISAVSHSGHKVGDVFQDIVGDYLGDHPFLYCEPS